MVNVKTSKSYFLPGKPNFISDNNFYGHSNYYGEEELVMIDIKKEEYITLLFNDVIIVDSYNFSKIIRCKVQDMNISTIKYVGISNLKPQL